MTVVSTASTAYIMSVFGWIPVNPVYAVIMGSVFGILFVIYQFFYYREIAKRIEPEAPKRDGELF
ncbi:MAG: hypothetical protein ACFFDR_02455 [Candidatus Thorarchaeota archaeon]